jgi:WD40 repeat protein
LVLNAETVASSSYDCSIKIWNFIDGKNKATLTQHTLAVLGVNIEFLEIFKFNKKKKKGRYFFKVYFFYLKLF